MTVPRAAYSLKLNTIIEPNVRLMRVQPTNLKVTLGQILASLSSFCWISNVAPYLQNSYHVRAEQTVNMLDDIIKRSVVGSLDAEKYNDERAGTLAKLLRYGTADPRYIWMMRYGMEFEDIENLDAHIETIDENGIVFKPSIADVSEGVKEVVKRYIFNP